MRRLLVACLFALAGCGGGDPIGSSPLTISRTPRNLSEAQALVSFDRSALAALAAANAPDSAGALSRNRDGYFSVRFQTGLSAATSFGIVAGDVSALDASVRALRYAFGYQDADGGFAVVAPPSLAASQPPASAGDIASAHAFFLSEVGRGLRLLDESSVWRDASSLGAARDSVQALRPQVARALDWMLAREDLLRAYDAAAPNRLLFDAQALATVGRWLGREDALEAARRFVRAALALQRADGVFTEQGGYDSSYQGVALLRALGTWFALPPEDSTRALLWEGIARGTEWQASRIMASGAISLDGNTRVYPGGERFLGEEKAIAWTDTVQAFWYVAALVDNAEWRALGDRVAQHYR